MSDIEKAKKIFCSGEYTCVLCKGDIVFTSTSNGISPMLDFIENKTELCGFSAADKIVGKAAAILFVYAGVSQVYADVMSKQAVDFLASHNVKYSFGKLADKIINRSGTGICPMEKTVEKISSASDISEVKMGVNLLREKRNELRGMK